jgi:hypothetical protein
MVQGAQEFLVERSRIGERVRTALRASCVASRVCCPALRTISQHPLTVYGKVRGEKAAGGLTTYKISGVGRENHRMMLDEYSEVKNLLVSYSPQPLGLF